MPEYTVTFTYEGRRKVAISCDEDDLDDRIAEEQANLGFELDGVDYMHHDVVEHEASDL